jgi:hypothetical protein
MDEPRDPRVYLLAISIGSPMPEHAEIPRILKELSGGDFRSLRFGGRGSLILLRCGWRAAEIAGSFAKVLLNEDQILVTEVGSDWWAGENLSAAQNWLSSRVARR